MTAKELELKECFLTSRNRIVKAVLLMTRENAI